MSILCTDKTGTLTTANISIHGEMIWASETFTKDDVVYYATLASNRDKKEDPIDRAVLGYFDHNASQPLKDSCKSFHLVRNIGFNPIYKRVIYQYDHPQLGHITIAKGLPNKVVDTTDGGEDDSDDQWKVENYRQILPIVQKKDQELSRSGYKTLGVSVKFGDNNPFKLFKRSSSRCLGSNDNRGGMVNLSVRTPSFFYLSNRPSYALICSINFGCLIVSILVTASDFFGSKYVSIVAIIWLFNIICLLFVDAIKVLLFHLLGESFDVLMEDEFAQDLVKDVKKPVEQQRSLFGDISRDKDIENQGDRTTSLATGKFTPLQSNVIFDDESDVRPTSVGDSAVLRLDRWCSSASFGGASNLGETILVFERVANPSSPVMINLTRKGSITAMIAAKRTVSAARVESPGTTIGALTEGKITVSSNYPTNIGSMIDLRHSKLLLSSSDLRPFTPSNINARK